MNEREEMPHPLIAVDIWGYLRGRAAVLHFDRHINAQSDNEHVLYIRSDNKL